MQILRPATSGTLLLLGLLLLSPRPSLAGIVEIDPISNGLVLNLSLGGAFEVTLAATGTVCVTTQNWCVNPDGSLAAISLDSSSSDGLLGAAGTGAAEQFGGDGGPGGDSGPGGDGGPSGGPPSDIACATDLSYCYIQPGDNNGEYDNPYPGGGSNFDGPVANSLGEQYRYGAAGSDFRLGALVADINSGAVFPIGPTGSFIAPADPFTLQLFVNDGYYADDSGSFQVDVEILPEPATYALTLVALIVALSLPRKARRAAGLQIQSRPVSE